MKRALHICFVLGILPTLLKPSMGSAEGSVPARMTAATIVTTEAGYQFEIKLDAKGMIAGITATYRGDRIPVPNAEIPPLKDADLSQTHVTGWRGYHLTTDALDSVILVIPFQQEFRKDPEGVPESEKIRVSNVARLLFADGKIVRWEMAVSSGEDSGAWALTCKDKGKEPEDNGKSVRLTNPYWSHNPINYSTEWSKKP